MSDPICGDVGLPAGEVLPMPDIFSPETMNYILRLYLPYWRLEERLQEILDWCGQTGARHVMLFTDAQYLVWNQLSLPEIEREVASLQRAKAAFDDHGITLGINATYNMRVSRTEHPQHMDYTVWATYADGVCDYRSPCLLDPKLDRYLDHFFRRLASVEPAFIYVDDDHRYILQGERGTWGCLCDLHVRRFRQRMGEAWTREELLHALREEPAVRRAWRAFLGERLVELAHIMEQAVHVVSPHTKVGMMVPCVHTLPAMGHTLSNVLQALHPDASKPLVRPCIGGYQDWNRRDLFAGMFYMEYTRHVLGDQVEYTPEIESTPGTRLAKSMAVMRFEIAQGILNGMPNPAISAASYDGDSPFLEPDFAPMLRESRPYFDAIRMAAPVHGVRRGVQLRWEFDSPDAVPGMIDSVGDLDWPAFGAAQVLGHLSIPTTFAESPLCWMIGDSVRCLDADILQAMLSEGLLLDARAARALGEMGYAKAIGCDVGGTVPVARGERLTDAAMSGQYAQCLIPLRGNWVDGVKSLQPHAGSRVISELVNDDLCAVATGVTLYENALGGRIAVLPYALHAHVESMPYLVRYHRREQLKHIFDWMCPDAFPVWLASPSDIGVQVWEEDRRLTVCLTNLSFDILDHVLLELPASAWRGDRGSCLTRTDGIRPLADIATCEKGDRWRIRVTLLPFDPVILRLDRM
jgi:hypothetical protein